MPVTERYRNHHKRSQGSDCWSPFFSSEHRIASDPDTVDGFYVIVSSGSGSRSLCTSISYPISNITMRGSGGIVPLNRYAYAPTTGGRGLIADLSTEEPSPVLSMVNTPTMVAAIKERFGLNVTQLSLVCKVERPTIYSWLSGSRPNSENLERLHGLYELSKELKGQALERADSVCDLGNGETLLNLLSQDRLETVRISAVLKHLRTSVSQGAAAPSTLADRLRALGFSESSEKDRRITTRQVSRSYAGSGQ